MEKLGKYRIEKELGQGAMGIVYLAFDPVIERKVAIKTMNPESFKDEEQRQRFVREAKSAGGLQHPNIVTIFDMGIDDNTPYIVMEFIEGQDLDELIRNSDSIPFKDKLSIMAQLCDALGFAHDNEIVHRDIKPANIRVLPNGKVKVMDFGIAKKQDSDLTRTGLVVGTISYMSPEQVQGKKISPKSDQFSAGVVFYQLLTGKKPFEGENITTVIFKIVSSKPEALNFNNIPKNIVDIITKMLANDEDQRFENCHKIAELLRQDITPTGKQTVTDSEPETEILSRPAAPADIPPPPPLPPAPPIQRPDSRQRAPQQASQPSRSHHSKSISKWVIIAIILISVLGVSGYFGYSFLSKKNSQKPSQAMRQIEDSEPVEKKEEQDRTIADSSQHETEPDTESNEDKSSHLQIDDSKSEQQSVNKKTKPKVIQSEKEKPGLSTASEPVKSMKAVSQKTETIQKPKPENRPKANIENHPEQTQKEDILSQFRQDFQTLRKRAIKMQIPFKKNESRKRINTGKRFYSNGDYLSAAKLFTEAIILDNKNVHAYSNLVICLEKLNAYEEAHNVLTRASRNGVSVSAMSDNIFFSESYNKIINR